MNTRTFLGTAIAVILVVNQHVDSSANICDTPKCVQEAAKIVDYIDTSADPCEDFYQFACGNFLRNSNGDEKLAFNRRVAIQYEEEMMGEYLEDIHESDHKMVKLAKKLFRECVDKWKINSDLQTVNEVLKKVGGWPVLEGPNWKEENFDWLNATYELRRLGYEYAPFLNLRVDVDSDTDKLIFKVAPGSNSYDTPEDLEDMAGAAVLFGAANKETALKDLTDAREFLSEWNQLYRMHFEYTKNTIEEFQKREGVIDWLKFINNLAGPKIQITKDDHIFFPTREHLKRAIELISRTSKRTLANYMMWKVVKPLLPFIPTASVNPLLLNRSTKRTEFCLNETRSRFISHVPSPLDVIRLRRHLSTEKNKKVENLVLKVIFELEKAFNKSELISEDTRHKIIRYIKTIMKVVVGLPGNYFDDKVLDQFDVDVGDIDNNASFFTLLAQVNRNQKTLAYTEVNTLKSDIEYGDHFLEYLIPVYLRESYVIYIPVSATKYLLYDENRPEYLNYGTLGTMVGSQLTEIFLLKFNTSEECLSDKHSSLSSGLVEGTFSAPEIRLQTIIETVIGEHLSYTAYQELVKNNGEEPKLVATNYTPNQLFWISAASLKCQPIGESKLDSDDYGRSLLKNWVVSTLSESFRQNANFAKDFNCPVNSKMNPSNKCKLD